MERLKLRLIVFGLVSCAFGVFLTFAAVRKIEGKAESWLEQQAPDSVGGFTYLPSAQNNEQSYRMDNRTYDLLEPYGIVSRVYQSSGRRIDVVLIASNNKKSFHDPRICFSGQGWSLENEHLKMVETASRGSVPVTFTTLAGREYHQGRKMAAYFYRGPDGFHSSTQRLIWSLFVAQALFKDDVDGVFYRFIALDEGVTEDELAKFIADYLEAANDSSKGYF